MKKRENKRFYLVGGITCSAILMVSLLIGMIQGKVAKAACDTHTTYITEQMDISEYRSDKDSNDYYTSVPKSEQEEDWIFAGWFADDTCETALGTDVTSGKYFAKFVPAHVLGVKAQISADLINKTLSDNTKGDMRFITSVDSLAYSKIGINVKLPTGNLLCSTKNTVYDKLSAVGDANKVLSYNANEVFCSMSKYFKTFTVTGIPYSYFDKKFEVTPYWVTKDGTLVNGETVSKTVNQGIDNDKVFVSGSKWDISKQSEGKITQSGGGYQTVDFYHKYDTMDLTLTVKDGKAAGQYATRRVGVIFEFTNGKKVCFSILNNNWSEQVGYKEYIIQTLCQEGNDLINPKGNTKLHDMTDEEIAAFKSEEGIDFRIVKDGAKFYLYLNNVYITPKEKLDFSEAIGENTVAKVTLAHWGAVGENLTIPFSVSKEIRKTFVTGQQWDASKQLEGKVTQYKGGYHTIDFADKYDTMDLKLTVKNGKVAGEKRRIGVIFEFENGKKVGFTLLNNVWGDADHYIIQTPELSGEVLIDKWKTLHDMTDSEKNAFNSENGIDFRIVKDGAKFYLYLNETLINSQISLDFTDVIGENTVAKVTLAHWGANEEDLTIPFSVGTKIPLVKQKTFVAGSQWDISKQDKGEITQYKGGNQIIDFADKYDTMDLKLTVKDGKATGKSATRRVGVIFEFTNGKKVCFSILNNNWKGDGYKEYIIQTLGQNTNDLINTSGNTRLHEMTDEEIDAFKSEEGIDFRIVKDGARFYLYLNGTLINSEKSLDFTEAIGENTVAKVTLAHWGAVGEDLTIPFTVSRPVHFTGLKDGKGTVTADKEAYEVGDKVTLTVKPDDGYRCVGLKVNGKELTANDDGTYSFIAKHGICSVVTTYE